MIRGVGNSAGLVLGRGFWRWSNCATPRLPLARMRWSACAGCV